ncbi:MAG: hypothetical protein A3C43_02660 [Candidatus Schekmanbacteria bacterium RIFCSPHIGHO2_02_FULL_38_11]|uniref:Response regulatory domain-containing protein n=1 Tax=Candidatus Schekmanbacteria bacterium RIFCSPLOWO2_12_FULL_38_15 TaxID=1817883 RepID=A0A1F7SI67_9BACT|nr:MAG: hypothetical protein A2043_06390 [Candidatus Schekmanbacteria bacterium GWA2_38_9]OGL50768.1 MAG: hypothetical protein A3H37_02845 [Candidatus Schekmanbacteria bacterium RIFCSPLOWO2_02_FULL_38_14]OGL53472.1 MAG: hypothetical protein A3G31_08220 [Candidatus Schekmanbacteria bacterium RIFCSPLOWO2_12_FULL_38_15]OGL54967.1 MAG: hypothetical protein A3C43_02660 [Candidatus Schekmanbacteria bacterium RIFCSPHIGHO2_02_FULL_38_11]
MSKAVENGKNVLILGNKRNYIVSLEKVLLDSDFSVEFLPNSEESKNNILKDTPDLIIVDLEEINPEEFILCEALRSHPLSYKIPFIFLTPKDICGDLAPKFVSTSDRFILRPFNLYTTLSLINKTISSLQKSEILFSSKERTIRGDLTQISLTDLIQIFFMNKRNGLLTVSYQTDMAKIYFKKGSVVFASMGKTKGLKAIFRLMTLKHGSFEFDTNEIPKTLNLSMNTEELLLDGMCQIDEIESIKESLPPLETVITVNRTNDISQLKSSEVLADIIRLCQTEISMRELIDNSQFPDLDVYEGLRILLVNGIIKPHSANEKEEGKYFDPLVGKEDFFKLRKFFKRIQWREGEILTTKLLIISSDEELEKDFIKSIETGFKDFSSGRKIYRTENEFRDIGSFRITHEAFISLCAFPSSVELSPLWELLSSNRIGTIVLFDFKTLSSLQNIKEALQFLSESNSFPVVYAFNNTLSEQIISPENLKRESPVLFSADIIFYKNHDALSVKSVLRKVIEKNCRIELITLD